MRDRERESLERGPFPRSKNQETQKLLCFVLQHEEREAFFLECCGVFLFFFFPNKKTKSKSSSSSSSLPLSPPLSSPLSLSRERGIRSIRGSGASGARGISPLYATVKLSAVPRAAAAPPALYQRLSPTTTSCTKSVFFPSLPSPTAAVRRLCLPPSSPSAVRVRTS